MGGAFPAPNRHVCLEVEVAQFWIPYLDAAERLEDTLTNARVKEQQQVQDNLIYKVALEAPPYSRGLNRARCSHESRELDHEYTCDGSSEVERQLDMIWEDKGAPRDGEHPGQV